MKFMDKRAVVGGVVGGLAMLIFSLGLLLLTGLSFNVTSLANNMLASVIIMLMAPFAGGFLAGLIAKAHARQAGVLAGLGASLLVLFSWLVIAGISWAAVTSGLVTVFVWVNLSRWGAGFSIKENNG